MAREAFVVGTQTWLEPRNNTDPARRQRIPQEEARRYYLPKEHPEALVVPEDQQLVEAPLWNTPNGHVEHGDVVRLVYVIEPESGLTRTLFFSGPNSIVPDNKYELRGGNLVEKSPRADV